MLKPPDERVRNALRVLSSNRDFETLVSWLHDSHAELVRQSESLNEVPVLFRNQGERALLSDFDRHLGAANVKR